jgi:Type VI secretion system/phage-baseplate injector OB domain
MATETTRRKGAGVTGKADRRSGFTVDPGPYEAIVKKVVPGSRMGQLRVWIPDWGDNTYFENDVVPSNPADLLNDDDYILVSYASPFFGKTYGTDIQQYPSTPQTAGESYGMFMVPPDIGNKVLVTFAGGDIYRGYWFACIYDSTSHHMVPAISRSVTGSNTTLAPSSGPLAPSVAENSNLPVTEFSTTDADAFNPDVLNSAVRPVHQYQMARLTISGLDRDKIRGAISSSSIRESPSRVFGISTPGAPSSGYSGTKSQLQSTNNPQLVVDRIGGHSFVMDDGADGTGADPAGTDQLIRLRTTNGHQILMNDTEDILYISSASGNQWLEFSADGSINIYGAAGFNLRSQGPINFHSDSAILMQSPVIQMNASGGKSSGSAGIIMNSTGSITASSLIGMTLKTDGTWKGSGGAVASLSSIGMTSVSGDVWCKVSSLGDTDISGTAITVKGGTIDLVAPVPPTDSVTGVLGSALTGILGLAANAPTNNLQDTSRNTTNNVWVSVPEALQSICTVVPAHEPWVGDDGKSRPKPQIPQAGGFLGKIGL